MGCTTSRTIEKNKNSHINNKIISNNIDESPFENKDSPRENEKSPKKSKMKQNKRRKSKIKSQSLSPDKKLSINFPNLNQINNQTPNTPIIINQKKDESKNENSQKEEKEEN